MLTQAQITEAVKSGRDSKTLDGRDYSRLSSFFPASDWEVFGFKLRDGAEPPKPRPWTRDEVLKQLASDVEFGFEKAIGRRGLSAGMMYCVVQMWMWVLEDDLQHMDDYAQYGLPLFKAVAEKYGFPNPIGDDSGSEFKYSQEAPWGDE